jgi:hypothetical protein
MARTSRTFGQLVDIKHILLIAFVDQVAPLSVLRCKLDDGGFKFVAACVTIEANNLSGQWSVHL